METAITGRNELGEKKKGYPYHGKARLEEMWGGQRKRWLSEVKEGGWERKER